MKTSIMPRGTQLLNKLGKGSWGFSFTSVRGFYSGDPSCTRDVRLKIYASYQGELILAMSNTMNPVYDVYGLSS